MQAGHLRGDVRAGVAHPPGAEVGRAFWVPEVPPGKQYGLAMYLAREPEAVGMLGEQRMLVTTDIHAALQFATREECESWIRANPVPVFVAVEHEIMPAPAPAASGACGRCGGTRFRFVTNGTRTIAMPCPDCAAPTPNTRRTP